MKATKQVCKSPFSPQSGFKWIILTVEFYDDRPTMYYLSNIAVEPGDTKFGTILKPTAFTPAYTYQSILGQLVEIMIMFFLKRETEYSLAILSIFHICVCWNCACIVIMELKRTHITIRYFVKLEKQPSVEQFHGNDLLVSFYSYLISLFTVNILWYCRNLSLILISKSLFNLENSPQIFIACSSIPTNQLK